MGAETLLMRLDQWSRSQAPPRVLLAILTPYPQTAAPAFAGARLLEIANVLPVRTPIYDQQTRDLRRLSVTRLRSKGR